MIVIPPISITSSMLTSSNVVEPDASLGEIAWVSGTTYAIGDRRVVVAQHKIYERVTAGAGTTSPELDPTNWLEYGPTNRWAMFDTFRNTATSFSSGLSVVITPGQRIDALAIMGAQLPDITITITVDAVVVYTYTSTMVSRNVVDYYDYFFAEFSYQQSLLLLDLPPVSNGVITITTTSAGNLSAIVIGLQEYLGYTQRGHANDALNFSTVDRDAYGGVTLVPRRSIPKTSQTLIVPKKDIPTILKIRESLKASPAVWSGLSKSNEGYFNALLILGIYKNISLTLAYPEYATCSIDLEEI